MSPWRIEHGDCLDVMRAMAAESIDAVATDPPYGIGFMGHEWDTFKPEQAAKKQGLRQLDKSPAWREGDRRLINPNLKGRTVNGAISSSQIEYNRSLPGQRGFQTWTEQWAREVLRVLKPGGHIVVCGAPRSYHRMACGVEDAGFEVRDGLQWLFGQGFPKSLNIGDGLGTALKPAHEPIVLARKPFTATVAANVERFGTGALNIDACRVGDDGGTRGCDAGQSDTGIYGDGLNGSFGKPVFGLGRWPSNVLLDEEAAELLDEQSGELESGANPIRRGSDKFREIYIDFKGQETCDAARGEDRGGASRFFYVAKPDRAERDLGCAHLPQRSAGEVTGGRKEGSAGLDNPRAGAGRTSGARNFHPTVKPIALMQWLCRLITPKGGTVLDPFLGSGTTGIAALREGFSFIGIEREAEYITIARARIVGDAPLLNAESPA